MVIYFTGTGNSRFVARAIANELGHKLVCANDNIKRGKKASFHSDKPYIFVFPVYLSTVAEIFRDFLMDAKFGKNKDAYFVATCAGTMGASPNAARELCEKKGLRYRGTTKIDMAQNYIALFKMTEEEEIARRNEAALVRAKEIAEVISNDENLEDTGVSAMEYAGTKLVEKLYNGPFTKTKKFYATDACISCGLCEKTCPLNNIALEKGRPVWLHSCIHCMACINRCPKGAIEYGKNTIGKKRHYLV